MDYALFVFLCLRAFVCKHVVLFLDEWKTGVVTS